jgi:glutamine amidotransferase
MIAVIDYGAGNLYSVKNALDFLGADVKITHDPQEIIAADKVILPGVGAFGDAMTELEKSGLKEAVYQAAISEKPFLGVCLGLHLLFEESEESPGIKGLGVLKGTVGKIPKTQGLKIPHIGWNCLTFPKESRLFSDIGERPFVYFVHSYYIKPQDETVVSAYTEYPSPLAVAVEKNNLFATQFHPEKSGGVGLEILKHFIDL